MIFPPSFLHSHWILSNSPKLTSRKSGACVTPWPEKTADAVALPPQLLRPTFGKEPTCHSSSVEPAVIMMENFPVSNVPLPTSNSQNGFDCDSWFGDFSESECLARENRSFNRSSFEARLPRV